MRYSGTIDKLKSYIDSLVDKIEKSKEFNKTKDIDSIVDKLPIDNPEKKQEFFFLSEQNIDKNHIDLTKRIDLSGDYKEEDKYWVKKPYAFVSILYDKQEKKHLYYVVEPNLDRFETQLKKMLKNRIKDEIMFEDTKEEEKEEVIEKKVLELINRYKKDIKDESIHKLLYYLKRDYIYYGKIDPLIRDNKIEDISCDAPENPIFVYHQDYQKNIKTNLSFSEKNLNSFIIKLAQKSGRHISVADPMVDGSLPDGSRIQLCLGKEVTDKGSNFTIRKFREDPFSPVELIKSNTFSIEEMAYLWLCIQNNCNLIFIGGTASGKTTSMNATSIFIPPESKIVSIEDTRELSLPHGNWISLVTRQSLGSEKEGEVEMFELLRSALRQRPEYLLVGEVRGKEAKTLFQAMNTGHSSYSTLHAESVESAIDRLTNPPIDVPYSMLRALDIICVQVQTKINGRNVRRNLNISEIFDIDPKSEEVKTGKIFQWNSSKDTFKKVGDSTTLKKIKKIRGWSDPKIQQELEERRKVLKFLVENNIDDWKECSKILHDFMVDRKGVIEKIKTN